MNIQASPYVIQIVHSTAAMRYAIIDRFTGDIMQSFSSANDAAHVARLLNLGPRVPLEWGASGSPLIWPS